MQDVERAAGQLFADYGMPDIAAHPPLDEGTLIEYARGGRAWVAEVSGLVVGYSLAEIVDGCGHLEQVSVDPRYGRQGLGHGLIQTVAKWAGAQGFTALTLITFRDVPWNGPYYAALGFQVLDDAALTSRLRALRTHEHDLGLEPALRQVMRLGVHANDDAQEV